MDFGQIYSRMDGWLSAITGVGVLGRDKAEGGEFVASAKQSAAKLAEMFDSDDVASLIVEAVIEDGTRKGWDLSIKGTEVELASEMKRFLDTLGGPKKLAEAARWGRLFGAGAVLVITDDSEDLGKPLELEKVNEIKAIHVLDARDIHVLEVYSEIKHAKWRQPAIFRGQHQDIPDKIHETRLIQFHGPPIAKTRRYEERPAEWGGGSVVNRSARAIRDYQMMWQALAHLTQDSSQAVFAIKNLIAMIASGKMEDLQTRFQAIGISRSVAKAVVIDADKERFERKPHNLTGLEKIADAFASRLAATARMPITRLMGQAPGGLNATGESDERNWFDQVSTWQTEHMKPALDRLIEIAANDARSPTGGKGLESWEVSFKPLRQKTDMEIATERKATAEADSIYVREGILWAEEVTLSRFGETGWSPDTSVDLEARRKILEAETKKEIEKAGQPDPEPPALPAPGDDPKPEDEPEPESE